MINSILEKHGLNTGLIGNVIVKMGSLIQPADLATPESLDLHGSYEQYYKAKASLVREAREDQWAVFNLDCPQTAPLINETRAMTFT